IQLEGSKVPEDKWRSAILNSPKTPTATRDKAKVKPGEFQSYQDFRKKVLKELGPKGGRLGYIEAMIDLKGEDPEDIESKLKALLANYNRMSLDEGVPETPEEFLIPFFIASLPEDIATDVRVYK